MPDINNNLSALLQGYAPERNIFGRSGRLFLQPIITKTDGSQELGQFQWLANVTEVSATMNIDRLEVRRAGDYFVKYKPGEVTGEGSLTLDKVNSNFEKIFIDHVNAIGSPEGPTNLPFFHVTISLEDPGIPGIQYDDTGFAEKGHEEVVLRACQFWSMPFGYSISDMVTRDLDFTFTGISFGGGSGGQHLITEPTDFPGRLT